MQFLDLRRKNAVGLHDGTRRKHDKIDVNTFEKDETFTELFKTGVFRELDFFLADKAAGQTFRTLQDKINYVKLVRCLIRSE